MTTFGESLRAVQIAQPVYGTVAFYSFFLEALSAELKEAFGQFWKYKSLLWAGGFLDAWCERAMRSRLEPMKKMARMLRAHEPLLMNWFRARGELSSAAVEGLNNKVRVVTRRAYGFRTYNGIEVALYHTLGRLPEPETTHRFC